MDWLRSEAFPMPEYKTSLSAGFDIQADTQGQEIEILPGEWKLIKTGLYLTEFFPSNAYLQVVSRSGLTLKAGLVVSNAPGIVDADFSNEIGVILRNVSKDTATIFHGDRIAQGVVSPFVRCIGVPVKDTERGLGGFGHSGV